MRSQASAEAVDRGRVKTLTVSRYPGRMFGDDPEYWAVNAARASLGLARLNTAALEEWRERYRRFLAYGILPS